MTELILQILFIVIALFVVVLIIFVIHLIGTARKLNKTIDNLAPTIANANKVIADVQPILEAARPAVQRVDPLLERVSLTVDAVNLEIMRADTILANVADVTDTAAGAIGKVVEITDAPLNLLNAATDKVRNILGTNVQKQAAAKSLQSSTAPSAASVVSAVKPAKDGGGASDRARLAWDTIIAQQAQAAAPADTSPLASQQPAFPQTQTQVPPQPTAPQQPTSQGAPAAQVLPTDQPAVQPLGTDAARFSTTVQFPAVQIPEVDVASRLAAVAQSAKNSPSAADTATSPVPPPAPELASTLPAVEIPAASPAPATAAPPVSTIEAVVNQDAVLPTETKIAYDPDFEPDDETQLPRLVTPPAREQTAPNVPGQNQDGFFLFYTDDSGLKKAH
ncbi:MAG: hypothetical protein LBU07_06560 [Coriobacteriales bacterium]|jgi:uncharacterized protein YoxC|nr:hypothetical protein [Coriobacteriales bacterium]